MLLRGVAQSGRRGLAARPVRVSARGLAAAAAAGQRILYRSTRGGQSDLTFSEAVLQGLGTDKGLLVPQAIPRFDAATLESWRGLPFHALAAEVMSLYLTDDDLSRSELEASQQPLASPSRLPRPAWRALPDFTATALTATAITATALTATALAATALAATALAAAATLAAATLTAAASTPGAHRGELRGAVARRGGDTGNHAARRDAAARAAPRPDLRL